MKCAYSVLLLACLLASAACLFQKKYIYVKSTLTWVDAQAYCRSKYVDLISLETSSDNSDFVRVMKWDLTEQSWLGLRKEPEEAFTQWSDGSPVEYTPWQNNNPGHYNSTECVTYKAHNWSIANCTEHLNFFCYSWDPQAILVQELMTWEDALMYCRTQYTDLVSMATETDFSVVNRSLSQQMTSVWTGMHFMDGLWFWVNNESLGSLFNLPSCPALSFRCGALLPGTADLENRNCMEKMNFICY